MDTEFVTTRFTVGTNCLSRVRAQRRKETLFAFTPHTLSLVSVCFFALSRRALKRDSADDLESKKRLRDEKPSTHTPPRPPLLTIRTRSEGAWEAARRRQSCTDNSLRGAKNGH